MLNNWWRSNLAVLCIEGFPENFAAAGNAIIKSVRMKVDFRIPPTADSKEFSQKLLDILKKDGPELFGAKVEVNILDEANGFDSPDFN